MSYHSHVKIKNDIKVFPQLLKTLTSNWRTPYLVWDNSTRAELLELMENWRMLEEGEPLVPTNFAYSAHEGLVPVGGVYLDIYNEQPDFPIEVCGIYIYFLRD